MSNWAKDDREDSLVSALAWKAQVQHALDEEKAKLMQAESLAKEMADLALRTQDALTYLGAGTITADKIVANQITADRIVAGYPKPTYDVYTVRGGDGSVREYSTEPKLTQDRFSIIRREDRFYVYVEKDGVKQLATSFFERYKDAADYILANSRPATSASVGARDMEHTRRVQREHGLVEDGIWGPRTQAAIESRNIRILAAEQRAMPAITVPKKILKPTKAQRIALTKETYRTRFGEMEYVVSPRLRFGFDVTVTLAEGGRWYYWRPTRSWADRTGANRLRRELARLDALYERDNPTGVRAKDIGIYHQMTSDELTAELAQREAEEREAQMAEWDEAFEKGKDT